MAWHGQGASIYTIIIIESAASRLPNPPGLSVLDSKRYQASSISQSYSVTVVVYCSWRYLHINMAALYPVPMVQAADSGHAIHAGPVFSSCCEKSGFFL